MMQRFQPHEENDVADPVIDRILNILASVKICSIAQRYMLFKDYNNIKGAPNFWVSQNKGY